MTEPFDPKTIRKGDVITLTVEASGPADNFGDVPLLADEGGYSGDCLYGTGFLDGTYRDVTVKRAHRPFEVGAEAMWGSSRIRVLEVSPCGKFSIVEPPQEPRWKPCPCLTADLERVDD